MVKNSDDIEALLIDVNDPGIPTPRMLPAIFRDIVRQLDAAWLIDAVVGRIALTLHEQARFLGKIEIVADLDSDGDEHASEFFRVRQARFAAHMPCTAARTDIGVDCFDYCPVTLDEIRVRLAENALRSVDAS